MSLRSEYAPFVLMGAGLLVLGLAGKRKPRKSEDRAGEVCDPDEDAPAGYQCARTTDGWKLIGEQEHFTGFGPYINHNAVGEALASVGFPDGDLAGFQEYASLMHEKDLRNDGVIDRDTMFALREAEMMLSRGEWIFPREGDPV